MMTKILKLLRTFVEFQQFTNLQSMAQSQWDETKTLELLPLLTLAHLHLGDELAAQTTWQQTLVQQSQLNTDALCDMAAVYIVKQQHHLAMALLIDILLTQPEHDLALARLALCQLAGNDIEAARYAFEQSLELNPKRIAVHQQLVNVYIEQKHYSLAQQQLGEAFNVLAARQAEFPDALYQRYWLQLHCTQLLLWVYEQHYAPAEEWLQGLYQQQQAGDCEDALVIDCLNYYCRTLAECDRHQQASELLRDYIRYYSFSSDLCLVMAELLQVQGHFAQAITLLQKALKNDPENIALWIKLSTACLHRFDKKARHAAEKAVALAAVITPTPQQPLSVIKQQQAQASHALALVETLEQQFDQAEVRYRAILAEHPKFIAALQSFGQQQMQRGYIEEALSLFERVKAIDPVKGYTALINARRFPEDEEVLEKIAAAAQRPSMEGSIRSGILFQLAAAWEQRKDYNKAFAFAKQANAASKKFLTYDGKAHRQKCARIRYCFNQALYQHRQGCGSDATLPVFVVGMPRSGTTLVEQILAGHSDIFGAGELGIIPQVIQGMNRWERHTGSGRQYPDCIDDYNAYTTKGIANNLLKELKELCAEDKPHAKHVVDKLPHNFENIGLIKYLFPKAKIISVRRDPRDIALSNYFTDYQAKHSGMGFAYDLTDIGEQLADHNLLMHHWQQIFPGEILEVQYEDVVDDVEGSARKLLNYIGVEWQSAVLNFNELERPVKTASVWQVRQPIYKTSKAKWQGYESYLAPLFKGTNAKINPEPIVDIITLPEPGLLTDGVDLYRKGDLNGAELHFKKMLHHNSQHAASHYMLGLVYLSKGYSQDGIAHLEVALKICPWQKEWRENLIKAYEQAGEAKKAEDLQSQRQGQEPSKEFEDDELLVSRLI